MADTEASEGVVPSLDETQDLRQALDATETVTHFLETLTGESTVADVVRQGRIRAGRDNILRVGADRTVIYRLAVLRGITTEASYVFAESTFVPDRLPEPVTVQLERSNDPIGRMLVAHGLRLNRELLHEPVPPCAEIEDAEIVLARRYRLMVDGVPTFAIREWFLVPVLHAVSKAADHAWSLPHAGGQVVRQPRARPPNPVRR